VMDKKVIELAHSVNQTDSKVAALRAYHRARGLYQYCAEKYVRGHKCAPTVQLQAVQELWGLFQTDSDSESLLADSDGES
jgi:hypothetical protein